MRIDRFVIQHLERIDEKIKERCKTSDSLRLNNGTLYNTNSKGSPAAQYVSISEETSHNLNNKNIKCTRIKPDDNTSSILKYDEENVSTTSS